MKKAERLKRRQERLHRLHLAESLAVLEKTHCKPCTKIQRGRNYSPEAVCGGCEIYSQIRVIGKEMINGEVITLGRKKNIDKVDEFDEPVIVPLPLTPEEYFAFKDKGMTDQEIVKSLNRSVDWLTKWKKQNNITFMFKKRGKRTLEKLTVESYNDFRAQGQKDKDIAKRFEMSVGALSKFKKENGLTSKYKTNDIVVESPPVEPFEEEVNQTMKAYFESRSAKSNEFKNNKSPVIEEANEIESLKDQLLESQSEIHRLSNLNESLKTQNSRLRVYENDYRSLEVDLRNAEYKCKSLAAENEDLKEVAVLNQLLMRQHVKFVDRQVPKEIEVNNQWR